MSLDGESEDDFRRDGLEDFHPLLTSLNLPNHSRALHCECFQTRPSIGMHQVPVLCAEYRGQHEMLEMVALPLSF